MTMAPAPTFLSCICRIPPLQLLCLASYQTDALSFLKLILRMVLILVRILLLMLMLMLIAFSVPASPQGPVAGSPRGNSGASPRAQGLSPRAQGPFGATSPKPSPHTSSDGASLVTSPKPSPQGSGGAALVTSPKPSPQGSGGSVAAGALRSPWPSPKRSPLGEGVRGSDGCHHKRSSLCLASTHSASQHPSGSTCLIGCFCSFICYKQSHIHAHTHPHIHTRTYTYTQAIHSYLHAALPMSAHCTRTRCTS